MSQKRECCCWITALFSGLLIAAWCVTAIVYPTKWPIFEAREITNGTAYYAFATREEEAKAELIENCLIEERQIKYVEKPYQYASVEYPCSQNNEYALQLTERDDRVADGYPLAMSIFAIAVGFFAIVVPAWVLYIWPRWVSRIRYDAPTQHWSCV